LIDSRVYMVLTLTGSVIMKDNRSMAIKMQGKAKAGSFARKTTARTGKSNIRVVTVTVKRSSGK